MSRLVQGDTKDDGDGEEKGKLDSLIAAQPEEQPYGDGDTASGYARDEGHCLGNADDQGEGMGDFPPLHVYPLCGEHEERHGRKGSDGHIRDPQVGLYHMLEKKTGHDRGQGAHYQFEQKRFPKPAAPQRLYPFDNNPV